MLRIYQPWDSQPQEAVELRADLAQELGFYGGFINPQVAWNAGQSFSPSGLSPSPTRDGLAISNTTGTAVCSYPFQGSPQSSELTIVLRAVRYGSQPDSGFGTALYAPKIGGSQDPFDWFIKDSGERVRMNTTTFDSSSTSWETTENWPIGEFQTAVFTWSSPGVPSFYRNGRLLSLSSSYGTVSGALKPSSNLSINLSALRLNGAVSTALIFNKAWTADQVAQYTSGPTSHLQLFAPRSIYVPVSAGGGDTTVSGSLGVATASGLQGTVQNSTDTTVTGSLGTASAVGMTATVGENRSIAGGLGTASASGLAATIGVNRGIAGALGTAVASGLQGTVNNTNDTIIGGGLGTATASGLSATVNANRTIAGALGTAVASGLQAGVTNDNSVSIAASLGTATASGFAATLGINTTIAGNIGEALALGYRAGVADASQLVVAGGGGWLPKMRRKTRKQIHEERVKLGILPPDVVKAAKKAAAVVVAEKPEPVKAYRKSPAEANAVFLRELGASAMIPDYGNAITAAIRVMQDEEDDLLMVMF